MRRFGFMAKESIPDELQTQLEGIVVDKILKVQLEGVDHIVVGGVFRFGGLPYLGQRLDPGDFLSVVLVRADSIDFSSGVQG